jgi:leucyl-tRNA---protein transferase
MEILPPQEPLRHFFATMAVPCPYLAGRLEQKLVVELGGDDAFYGALSRAGFRRSHNLAYRPTCQGCNACVPVRIAAQAFAFSRGFRRVLRRNDDLTVTTLAPRATRDQYRLFSRYQRWRHGKSDMAGMSYGDYRAMLEDTPVDTLLIEARSADGRLVAGCITDRMVDGLSAVYSFYDDGESRRGLGTFMILWLVRQAQSQRLPYVYLGYWVTGSTKMDYKRRFPALEALSGAGWAPLAAS